MKLFLQLVSIVWSNRAILIAAIPVVMQAQKAYAINSDKKAWAVAQLEALKQFTPDIVDRGIEVAVQLLQLGGKLK